MNRYSPPALTCWLLEYLVPVPYREAMVGDLLEEYLLRLKSTSRFASLSWFFFQACRSFPFLVWSSLRSGWPISLGVATGMCIVMLMLKFVADSMISRWIDPGSMARLILLPALFLLKTSVGGCITARVRPGSTTVLALMVMIIVAILIMTNKDPMPLPWWYYFGFLTLGPLTVLLTAAVFQSRKAKHRVA